MPSRLITKKNLILVGGALAVTLGYVSIRINIYNLSYSINSNLKLERELTERNRKLKIEVASLKTPGRIETLAKEKLKLRLDRNGRTVMMQSYDTKDK